MGLARIFIFSVLSGISVSLSLITTDEGNFGFGGFLLNSISQFGDSQIQAWVSILSIIFSIIFIFSIAKFFFNILDKRLLGILTAIFGFTSTLIMFTSSLEQSNLIILGVALLIVGLCVVILGRK